MDKQCRIPEQSPDETAIGRRSHRPNLCDHFFFDRRQGPCGPALHECFLRIGVQRDSECESPNGARCEPFLFTSSAWLLLLRL